MAADAAERRVEHRKAEVARGEVERFIGPQMHFPIAPDQPVRAKQHGRIEQLGAGFLGDAGDDDHVEGGGRFQPGAARRTVRDRFGKLGSLAPACEYVAGVAQFRQHREPRSTCGRLLQQGDGVGDVALGLAENRLHLDRRDGDGCFCGHALGPRYLAVTDTGLSKRFKSIRLQQPGRDCKKGSEEIVAIDSFR